MRTCLCKRNKSSGDTTVDVFQVSLVNSLLAQSRCGTSESPDESDPSEVTVATVDSYQVEPACNSCLHA